jgi:hypothetical protein
MDFSTKIDLTNIDNFSFEHLPKENIKQDEHSCDLNKFNVMKLKSVFQENLKIICSDISIDEIVKKTGYNKKYILEIRKNPLLGEHVKSKSKIKD